MKLGVIVGSIREGRVGAAVGQWVAYVAAQRPGWEVEVLDLRDFDLPLLTSETLPMTAGKQYDDPRVQAWSDALDACAAYVFVTAEYNHSVPGAFKNAIDSVGPELVGKPVGFVGYGADGAVRAVEHWRGIVANFSMHAVRAQVALNRFTEFTDAGNLQLAQRREAELGTLLEQVEAAASALGTAGSRS